MHVRMVYQHRSKGSKGTEEDAGNVESMLSIAKSEEKNFLC